MLLYITVVWCFKDGIIQVITESFITTTDIIDSHHQDHHTDLTIMVDHHTDLHIMGIDLQEIMDTQEDIEHPHHQDTIEEEINFIKGLVLIPNLCYI